MKNDRFKFRVPIRCNKCGFKGFQYWEWDGQKFTTDDWDECQCEVSTFEIIGAPQQCTGQKDKNGKLIFEGDLLSTNKIDSYDGFRPQIIEVYFNYKEGILKGREIKLKYGADYPLWQSFIAKYDFEIIGNIHEEVK